MPDKIVNHFVLADGSIAKYDAGCLINLDETVSLAGYAPDAKAVGDVVGAQGETLKNDIVNEPRFGLIPEIVSGYYNLYTGAFTEDANYSNFKIWYSKIPNVTNDFHSVALWKNDTFVGGYARANIPETLPDFDEVAIIWYKKTYQTGDVVILDNSVLLDRLETSETDISNLDKFLYIQKSNQITYSDMMGFDLGYINSSGNVVSYANAYVSDFIEVLPSSVINYNLWVIIRSMYGLTWYDDTYNRIDGLTQPEGAGGNWSNISGTIELPANAKYIKVCARKSDNDSEIRQQTATYISKEYLVDAVSTLMQSDNHWEGKKWYAFGTSITDTNNTLGIDGTPTGKYVPYLQELSGMIVFNYGIAGGTIGSMSSGNILAKIKSTDLTGADLITLEGFVNDFVTNLPLGDIGDTDNSTFAGALYDAITYMQSNSDATIVLITETTGRTYDTGNFVVTRANANGVYQYQFNDMIKKMSAYLGVHCIDAGQKSQINQWNVQYLADWIHHTELGGKQYAEAIWEELKDIHCNTDVSVS